jgi:hypothetical protein
MFILVLSATGPPLAGFHPISYFQQMLKRHVGVKGERPEERLGEALLWLLREIPFIRDVEALSLRTPRAPGDRPGRAVELGIGSKSRWRLLTIALPTGQPAMLRSALARLREEGEAASFHRTSGVILAPFISDGSAQLCRAAGVGFLDLAGNCELCFDTVFIRQRAADNPLRARRELRSLFTPRAAQVLHALLTPPRRHWKVTELAMAAGVSLGHVSNVRRRLVALEWAQAGPEGLVVTRPEQVLEAWRNAPRNRGPERLEFYGPLTGRRLEEAVRQALSEAQGDRQALLASYSAAQWLAPFARQSSTFFEADREGLALLQRHLQLQPVDGGGNVFVTVADDDLVFKRRLEPAPGIWCTGLVDTWLALGLAGDRGVEAADHLLQQRWKPAWEPGR